ncbi:MAG TPA: 23S rRNA (adenine(2030)-N(6))-methyltransferase RlmJ [Rhizomicrobium sp.]|nr:23S rRNA (adenine(2030)-N(6))-methyltransferase RlmJ [Rhizomicrobium sp.]
MNYRHAYHAGNFADVMKHAALVAVLGHLKKKDKPFRVIDSHAGRGVYDLSGAEAAKTGEAQGGVARLEGLADMPPALAAYAELVRGFGPSHYPGSPLIAARLLRPADRLVAIEKHSEEFAVLAAALHPFATAKAVEGDGYDRLIALLPPPERRGLVLIDPPYEAEDEFAQLARAMAGAYRRFATGIYLIWFPVKRRIDAGALAGEIRNLGVAKLLLLTLDIGRAADAPAERLSESGLLVVNPPFGFAEEMQAVLAFLAAHLAQGPGANGRVEWLAGEG